MVSSNLSKRSRPLTGPTGLTPVTLRPFSGITILSTGRQIVRLSPGGTERWPIETGLSVLLLMETWHMSDSGIRVEDMNVNIVWEPVCLSGVMVLSDLEPMFVDCSNDR